jgi:RNA polymerase sigma factor (sigma-70 family)
MKSFGVTLTAKLRHAGLWRAVKAMGSQSAVARKLGVSAQEFCGWVNMRTVPRSMTPEREKILFDLTGETFADLFPPELRDASEFLAANKAIDVTREIPCRLLQSADAKRLLLPSAGDLACEQMEAEELHADLANAIRTLPFREREIIKMRYGFGDGECYTLEEVAHVFKRTRETIRQLEARAIRRLQQPNRKSRLANHFND